VAHVEKTLAVRSERSRASSFTPTGLAERLKGLEFTHVRDFGTAEATIRYLAGRPDGLQFPQRFRLMKARVGRAMNPGSESSEAT